MLTNRFKNQLSNYDNDDDIDDELEDEAEKEVESQNDEEDLFDEIEITNTTWRLDAKKYGGTILNFYKTAKNRWYLSIRLDKSNLVFQTTLPLQLDGKIGFGSVIARLKEIQEKVSSKDLIGKHISFTIENNTKDGVTYSNITKALMI